MARYTILACSPSRRAALLEHHDNLGSAYWYFFGGNQTLYYLSTHPSHDFVPETWTTEFPDTPNVRPGGPQFATIDELKGYLHG
jgi:hypothetical protein